MDFSSSAVVQRLNQLDADLSGLPLPSETIPDPPYEVTVPPPTDSTPTCASSFDVTYSNVGVRFGSGPDSYINFNLTQLGQTNLFRIRYVQMQAIQSH